MLIQRHNLGIKTYVNTTLNTSDNTLSNTVVKFHFKKNQWYIKIYDSHTDLLFYVCVILQFPSTNWSFSSVNFECLTELSMNCLLSVCMCVYVCLTWQSEGRPFPVEINELRMTLINDSKQGAAKLSLLCHSRSSHSSSALFWSVDRIACVWPITAQPLPKPTMLLPIKILTTLIESNVGHLGPLSGYVYCKYAKYTCNYTCRTS